MARLAAEVRGMANRFFLTTPIEITAEEFISGFIDPDHVSILRQTEKICGHIGSTGVAEFPIVVGDTEETKTAMGLSLSFNRKTPIIIPNYVADGLRESAPEALRAKITEWAEQRFSHGSMFGDALDALEFLNRLCANAQAMTVMMPIVPILMHNYDPSEGSRMSKIAAKLTAKRAAGKLPMLPRKVTQRFQDVSAFLTAVSMLGKDGAPTSLSNRPDGAVLDVSHRFAARPHRLHMCCGIEHIASNQKGSFF
jgi:hypothetical protein